MAYLLDANIFIQAKNLHYGFDFCPAFWNWLIDENSSGKVYSIEKVGDELIAGDDELATWASVRAKGFFLPLTSEMIKTLTAVSTWVAGQSYESAAQNTFFQVADYYLIAHAIMSGFTVVTHERPSGSVKRIKIPDVCIGMGVSMVSPYEMLRNEKARFVLG